jgi:hypothetical protein
MKEVNDMSCPNCNAELGPVVAALKNGERDADTPVQMCFNVHCDFRREV